jgi:hypothetical protein
MRWLDRIIFIVLAAGLWALVLQPTGTTAHSNDNHDCSGTGTGFGELGGYGREVYVQSLNLDIQCSHY